MPAKAVLRRVVLRKPVPFLLYPERKDRADYLGVYMVETLECGHELSTFPQIDPLIAKFRRCDKCDVPRVIPIRVEVAVPKKPPQSVRIGAVERKRA